MATVVLGANSFSGQDFIDLLMREGETVAGFGRSDQRPTWNCGVKPTQFYKVDINQKTWLLCGLIDEWRPETIVNFAAQSEVAPSWESPEDWFQTNCVALAKLVNHLRQQAYLKKFVQISSPEVYGDTTGWCGGTPDTIGRPLFNPSTPYATSKAAADMLLACYHRQFGFPLVTVRSTNVCGPRQQLWKLIPKLVVAAKQGRKIPLHGGGNAVKSYIHIRDVSRGELAILQRGRVGEVYHLSPDRGVKVVDVANLVAVLMGKKLDDLVEVVPERPGQDACYQIDSSKARNELGWAPVVCFRNAVEEVIKWVDENWTEIEKQPHEYQHRP